MSVKLPALTVYETELLGRAMPFAQEQLARHSKLPSVEDLRIYLSCGQPKAEHVRQHIQHILASNARTGTEAPQPVLKEVNEIKKDTWEIGLPRTTIHTLAELVEYCKIDLATWEVERWVANKWEMGYKDDDGKAHTKPLYQVKAFLRRKQFSTLAEYAKDNARLRVQCEKLKLSVRSEHELATRLAQNHAGYDDILANVKEFVNVLGDISLPYQKFEHKMPLVTPAVSEGHTEDAVLLFSDTHYGDRIRREDTSGFPEYDLVIGGNRTGYVINKTKQVLTLHRAMYPLKTLKVWFGGDIGNGDLHDAPVSNELFLPAQVHFSYHMLKFAIEDLLTLTVPMKKATLWLNTSTCFSLSVTTCVWTKRCQPSCKHSARWIGLSISSSLSGSIAIRKSALKRKCRHTFSITSGAIGTCSPTECKSDTATARMHNAKA
jgi:hypothetical protein